jgi:hypothetical protein
MLEGLDDSGQEICLHMGLLLLILSQLMGLSRWLALIAAAAAFF